MPGVRFIIRSVLSIALIAVAGCTAPPATGINDPFEGTNRRVHNFNKEIDRAVLRPLSRGFDNVAEGPASRGISNFSSNLGLPGAVANDLLQLKIDDAFVNTARFVMNTTFGVAGLFDVATPNGLNEKPTDFGETLHVWGFPEGPFVELPFLSASTVRDTTGMVVDFVFDPVNSVVPTPQRYVGTLANVVNSVGNRSRYSDLVDQLLYESEDSYAQTRLVYLQSRRKNLQGGLVDADLEDPYAE